MKKNYFLFFLFFIFYQNLQSKLLDIFSSEKVLYVDSIDELFFEDNYQKYKKNLDSSYENCNIFYSNEKENLEKYLDINSGINCIIVFGEKSCGKSFFIEKSLNDSLKENKNFIPIKITKTLFVLFEEVMNFLETGKNKKFKIFNKNTKKRYSFNIENFTLKFLDFLSEKKSSAFVFYLSLKDLLPRENFELSPSFSETNSTVFYHGKFKFAVKEIFILLHKYLDYLKIKRFKNSIENLKSFFKLINFFEDKNNLKIKTIIETDSFYEFEFANNLINENIKNNLKEIIRLENISKSDLFNYLKSISDNQKIKISNLHIRKIVNQLEKLSFFNSIRYSNAILERMNKIENKIVTENFINNLLVSIRNSKNFEDFIKKSILNNSFYEEIDNSEEKIFVKKNFEKEESVDTKFDDVAGNNSAKEILNNFVNYLKNPDKYINYGIQIEKGILLHGPPGCGKTLLAKALAGEANVPFFYVSGSEFNKIYVGTGSENIKNLFKSARAVAPCIIFFDEIDSLAGNRFDQNNHSTGALNQLLVELDGFKKDDLPILVIGATNTDPKNLDAAVTRPGRLGKLIECKNPIFNERIELAKIATKNKFISEDVTYEYIAKKTFGFSGAEMVELLNSAAFLSLNKDKEKIDISDLNEAYERMILGFTNPNVKISEKLYLETAYHELGHTFCMLFNKDYSYKFDSVSILPRNFTLGVTHSVNIEEDFSGAFKKEELLGSIICSLGGMIAEEIFMKTTTAGVSDDLKKAKKLAFTMVTAFGMEGINLVGKDEKDEEVKVAVKKILDNCYQKAYEIINSRKELMEILAKKLVEEKVLYAKDIQEICKENGYLI